MSDFTFETLAREWSALSRELENPGELFLAEAGRYCGKAGALHAKIASANSAMYTAEAGVSLARGKLGKAELMLARAIATGNAIAIAAATAKVAVADAEVSAAEAELANKEAAVGAAEAQLANHEANCDACKSRETT